VPPAAGPALDAGCAAGGTTFALAEGCDGLVLGVDLNFAMLRIASAALREGRVRYARRRVGLVYDRVEHAVESPARERIDFWCCDAAALPFAGDTFDLAASINLVDCVAAPQRSIEELARVLRSGGSAVVATPYDWSPGATPVENWIGGHSQRGPHGGACEPLLRSFLAGAGFDIACERERVAWRVRLHDRSSVDYDIHAVVARKRLS
jgi:SAM-dependent methyltransferase